MHDLQNLQGSQQILRQRQPTARRWLVTGLTLASALMALAGSAAQAQTIYRIVGPDGKVTFSDKPPVATAKVTGQDIVGKSGDSGGSALPSELQQVVNKYPVTFYTAKDCAPCDSGRTMLRGRGVPFTEKTVTTAADSESLQRISGGNSLPVLTIGDQQLKGFSDAEWLQYLIAAGYPEKGKLPAGYRNPSPEPLVVIAPATAPAKASEAPAVPKLDAPPPSRVNPNNPAGIQF